ncbi:MAG: hypothetical protein IT339_09000, partial [Thermomicrobiales bacterium]|nr:hypothetical protein [Thermomicrobiales bacterium]
MTMTFTLSYDSGNPLEAEADALILPVRASAAGEPRFEGLVSEANTRLGGELERLAADARFTGKPGSTLVAPTIGQMKTRRVVLT